MISIYLNPYKFRSMQSYFKTAPSNKSENVWLFPFGGHRVGARFDTMIVEKIDPNELQVIFRTQERFDEWLSYEKHGLKWGGQYYEVEDMRVLTDSGSWAR